MDKNNKYFWKKFFKWIGIIIALFVFGYVSYTWGYYFGSNDELQFVQEFCTCDFGI